MGVILDTNVFIVAERSKDSGKLEELISKVPSEYQNDDVYISVITASELLMGVHRALAPEIRSRRQLFVDSVLDQFPAISISLGVAREHSRISADLRRQGNIIGTHDSWIAASALHGGHAVMSSNGKEFSRVDGLTVIDI
ncbi:MAG: PIN domain-containing protein [Verrucomicrobiales bacterium]|nr:PIN domain-containing protein [Verrucomicrobiales bacterium]